MTAPFTSIVIAGAGGLGREVAVYVRDAVAAGMLSAQLRGFLDDTEADPKAFGIDVPVLGTIDDYRPVEGEGVLVAVGAPSARRHIVERLARRDARFATLIHPLAYVAWGAEVGEGCIVAPFATIGTAARLGAHCLVNTHAGIGHDTRLGTCCVISPHGVVNGFARLGDEVLVGSSAVVTPQRVVADRAQVSAGSVVQSDVAENVTVWGNPARPLPQAPGGR